MSRLAASWRVASHDKRFTIVYVVKPLVNIYFPAYVCVTHTNVPLKIYLSDVKKRLDKWPKPHYNRSLNPRCFQKDLGGECESDNLAVSEIGPVRLILDTIYFV
jgi:hypothetical protein